MRQEVKFAGRRFPVRHSKWGTLVAAMLLACGVGCQLGPRSPRLRNDRVDVAHHADASQAVSTDSQAVTASQSGGGLRPHDDRSSDGDDGRTADADRQRVAALVSQTAAGPSPAPPTARAKDSPDPQDATPERTEGSELVVRGQSPTGSDALSGSQPYHPGFVAPSPTPQQPVPQQPAPQTAVGQPPATSAPQVLPPPGQYESTLAPGATQFSPGASTTPPLIDPNLGITAPGPAGFQPRERVTPIDVYVQEARTGRIILGGSVNSNLGVAGQLIIDERNFDIHRFPRSWDDLFSGRAFRGGGQRFRLEAMPGSLVQRYTVSWTQPNLFGYLPYSLSVGGFLYTRRFRDWTEQRLGGRLSLGYQVTKDLSASAELRMEDVKIFDPRISGVPDLDSALGSNDLYTARFRVARDTRDSPFLSTEGSLLEMVFDQVFGEYDYSRGNLTYSRYFLLRERPDGTGRHVLASTMRFGITGKDTPIFDRYFVGGYSTLRGFRFRGASPKISDVQVGGRLLMIGSLEYVFPLTADEMLRGVAFVDYGTVEQDIEIKNFRVSPGLGLRVMVPALGPAPLAFDFAYPVNKAPNDETQVFSFFMGLTR